MTENTTLTILGAGYVGLSNAVLLSQRHSVVLCDIDESRIQSVNDGKSPIVDSEIQEYLSAKRLNLTATTDKQIAFSNADFIIVATPTNYDTETQHFDTSTVEQVISEAMAANDSATIIIKSTIPVGFTESMRQKYSTDRIIFSPEFLREGRALYDNLHPTRIIVGDTTKQAKEFADLLAEAALDNDVPVLHMSSTEAEAVKLFANAYLAMRVAYFNELDTYAEVHKLDAGNIIKGMSLDPRIGNYYNNPSFGYGGYCLPKDTKQLHANYKDIPNDLIGAIVEANTTRMKHIADMILARNPKVVGIYKLAMKMDSDNFRQSSIHGVIGYLAEANVKIVIYEPTITGESFEGYEIVNDLDEFKRTSDVVVANRITDDIREISDKVYSRDIFSRD